MKLPLRVTVVSAFTIFTALSVLLVGLLDYISSRKIILDESNVRIALSASAAERGIDKLLSRALLTAESAASLPQSLFDWRSSQDLQAVLTENLRHSPEIYGIYVGFPDGAFIQVVNFVGHRGVRRDTADTPKSATVGIRIIGPNDKGAARQETWRYFDDQGKELPEPLSGIKLPTQYDPRERLWFKQAHENDGSTLSKVYVYSKLKKPGVTVSTPLRDYPGAIVGVDLLLSDLAHLTKQLSPGKNGVVAIYDTDGVMVAHPTPEKIVTQNPTNNKLQLVSISEIDDIRVRKARETAAHQQQSNISFAADGQDYIAYVKPVGNDGVADWNILSVANVADFTHELSANFRQSLMIVGVVLVVSVLGNAFIANWVTFPILRLRKMADQITQLNLKNTEHIKSPFDEIEGLQKSMEGMRSALDTFLRFVPRELVRELIQSGQAAKVGGAKRKVTLLFTDIESFTTMSESMTPEQVMTQVSAYFEQMSFAIQSHRGTIDKFIGDAIMAMWNAPVEDDFHIENACRGALTARSVSEALNEELAESGAPIMRTRFGLHSGEALVGNVGASDRMQYTSLGASVNLAARIEGLNKFYGTQILASDAIRRGASSDFLFRRVDIVEAKGTTIPVTIYELLGERGDDSPFFVGTEMLRRASLYEQAFDHYLHRDFKDALDLLDKLADETPDDRVVQSMKEKCRLFNDTPPPNDWNGATALDEK
jgi:adenylate cyclase